MYSDLGHLPRIRVLLGSREVSAEIDTLTSENFIRRNLLTESECSKIQPGPPYAQLGAIGATMQLDGTLELSPQIHGSSYSAIFNVSPELRAELVFGRPWLKKHHVIHDHAADSIYLGTNTRQRIYLAPLPTPYEPTNYPIPELEHGFSPEFVEEFLDIIRTHAPIFYNGNRLKQTITVEHEIELSDPRPFRKPPRRYSDEKRLFIDTQIRDMLRDGIIEPTTSPFSSAIVVAGKRDGDYRFCVDYRRLNDQTVDTVQTLPRIHEILKDLGRVKVFSCLDLKSG